MCNMTDQPGLVNHVCAHTHTHKQTYKILAVDNSVCKLMGDIWQHLPALLYIHISRKSVT